MDRSMSGSMVWISSSMGRATGALTNGMAAGVWTAADPCGIWAIGEPQRLQKTDPAGTLLPHFEQNVSGPGAGASGCLATGADGTTVTGLVVRDLRTGFISSGNGCDGRS